MPPPPDAKRSAPGGGTPTESNAVGGVRVIEHGTTITPNYGTHRPAAVCSSCGADPLHPAGTGWLCAACFDRILGDARARYIADNGGVGIMRHHGVMRPDHGPHFAECRCSACGATAVVVIGEPCAWCEWAIERQRQWQAQLVLRPPDTELTDPRRSDALQAWAERLARAVDAELVTRQQARAAWDREVGRSAA